MLIMHIYCLYFRLQTLAVRPAHDYLFGQELERLFCLVTALTLKLSEVSVTDLK